MPTDLGIAVFGRSTFLQIHAFEDGILSELLPVGQDLLATIL